MLFEISDVQVQLPVDDVTYRRDLPRALFGHGLGVERGQVVRHQLVEDLLPIGEETVEGRIGDAGPVRDGTGGHRLDAPLVDECVRRVENARHRLAAAFLDRLAALGCRSGHRRRS